MNTLLATEGLTKHFGKVSAVDRVTLTFQAGVLTSVIGPNGAGKTTLINLLTGNVRADGGAVYFRGEAITHLPIHARVRRGICRSFQLMNIFPGLTVFQNLQIPVLARLNQGLRLFTRLREQRQSRDEVLQLLAEIGLREKRAVPAGSLSHGDQRLLEIGLALAVEPELLFLDEPTAGMNPVERRTLLENIRRLAGDKRTTFIVVEHDMDVVFALSDRIIVMHRGQVIADGKPQIIRDDAQVREIYLGEELG